MQTQLKSAKVKEKKIKTKTFTKHDQSEEVEGAGLMELFGDLHED